MGITDSMILIKNNKSFSVNVKILPKNISRHFVIENIIIDAAHKKGSGSTKNGRDSVSKRRGIKIYGKQFVNAGSIIVRQVGSIFHPGFNVGSGKDYTLFAISAGIVSYERIKGRKCVSVYSQPNE